MAPSDPKVTTAVTLAITVRASTSPWGPRGQAWGQGPCICPEPTGSWACPGCAPQSSWCDPRCSLGSCAPSVCPSVCLGCLGKVKHHFLRGSDILEGEESNLWLCCLPDQKCYRTRLHNVHSLNQSQLALLANAAFHSWETALGELL